MLNRSKQFVKVTKKGSVVKVLREHYLRDDISCGIEGCKECCELEGHKNILSGSTKPILVIDTNIVLHQMDILEQPSINNVIICTTVMEETRNRNRSLYERLRTITSTKQEEKKFFVFSNEFHRGSFIGNDKDSNESTNDRNDRAIRKVVQWYQEHNPESEIILLTDDAANRSLAKEQSIKALSMDQYLRIHHTDTPSLLDMLSASEETKEDSAEFTPYIEHLTPSVMALGIEKKTLFQGTFNISPYNILEGTIIVSLGKSSGDQEQILIIGRTNMNRAIHGDLVAVELFPESEWKSNQDDQIVEDESDQTKTNETDINNQLKKQKINQTKKYPTGKVVGILKKNWRGYCGSLISREGKESGTSIQSILFVPTDRRVPMIRIKTSQASELRNRRIIVTIDSWPRTSKYPLGHYRQTIGTMGELGTETEVVLIEHEVAYGPFSQSILECLPNEGHSWKPSDEDYATRADFRDLDVCSIDPPGCTDIDDALHARKIEGGLWEVGVHIADVTHFVKPNTPMDEEAAKRATSVYLVDRRIDMLPELLGSDLCSLHSDVERLAFSCIWIMNEKGEISNIKFTKSIIKSKRSFTYDQAQAILDDPNTTDPLAHSVKQLNAIAQVMRKRRMDLGALTLASPEVRFKLEEGSQDPLDVEVKEMKAANALVEEFMLLANVTVAERIYQSYPDHSLLRRHPIPPQANFDNLKSALALRGLYLDSSTNKSLGESLDAAIDPNDPYFNTVVRILTTRCMMQAAYFASGSMPYQEFKHYGLAMPIYTHFTSPIRRYADVMVHRLLDASISQGKGCGSTLYQDTILTKTKISEICENLNFRHRMAQFASRASIELYTTIFFRKFSSTETKRTEDGYVVKVCKNGFVVLIPRYGIEGMIKVQGHVQFDPEHFHYVDMQGNVWISLFQKVKVLVGVEERNMRSKVELVLVSE